MPDGQISGTAGSKTSRRLAHPSRSIETTPSPPMPNISRIAFHAGYAVIGSVTNLASGLCGKAKAGHIVAASAGYGIHREEAATRLKPVPTSDSE